MNKGLVLLSGGLDSSTLACSLVKKGLPIEGLFINYGQKMAVAEQRSAEFIASWAGFSLKTISIPLDDSLTIGCLFENGPMEWDTHFVSFLPQRNLLFLTLAAMYAEKQGITEIYIGVIRIGNTPFPDTTIDFLELAQSVLKKSYPNVILRYPFIDMSKTSIVLLAEEIGMPIDATYSCEMASDHHCMKCPSCLDRYWALKEKGGAL